MATDDDCQVVPTGSLPYMVPVIKVVGDYCNLKCRYCYYNSSAQSNVKNISLELVEYFIQQYLSIYDGTVSFIWHGGEPLLIGRQFFEDIVRFQDAYKKKSHVINNYIQTNATLLSEKWISFLDGNGFKVGVSVDGDALSHDANRVSPNGKGTHSRVTLAIQLLRSRNVRHGAIQTVTKQNLANIVEDFDYLTNELGLSCWGINAYLDIEESNSAMREQGLSNEDFANYLIGIIGLWLEKDDPGLRIREIDNFLSGVMGRRSDNCSFNGACTSYFCLEQNGDIYPCDRMSFNEEYCFGNLYRESLAAILNSKKRMQYASSVNRLPDGCQSCEWLNACRNGCPYHRRGGIEGKYFYCEARKKVFAYLQSKVIELSV